jgi:hypothetical protein
MQKRDPALRIPPNNSIESAVLKRASMIRTYILYGFGVMGICEARGYTHRPCRPGQPAGVGVARVCGEGWVDGGRGDCPGTCVCNDVPIRSDPDSNRWPIGRLALMLPGQVQSRC